MFQLSLLNGSERFLIAPLCRFQDENEEHLEANQKAEFATQAVAQWLSIRLQGIGIVIITGVGLIGVIQHGFELGDSGTFTHVRQSLYFLVMDSC